MRIIAGEKRSMAIAAPKGQDTRPTQDYIRESLFNILRAWLPDARVLDLFAGSGALGLEALWPVQVQLAVMSYRRMGAEGQTSHEEGGVRMSFDAELNSIKEQLKRWRVGYVGMQREASA